MIRFLYLQKYKRLVLYEHLLNPSTTDKILEKAI